MATVRRSKPVIGYRFHPTDQELVGHFLNRKITHNNVDMPIAEVKVCDFEPGDLPDQSKIKSNDQVWYFFCPRDFKYLHSRRSNRTTKAGYWKPTGKPRKIRVTGTKKVIGTKRSLVFYKKEGRKSVRTKWIMHEYESQIEGNFLVCKLKDKQVEKISKGENQIASASTPVSVLACEFCGECELSDHMGSDFEDRNLNEMTAISTYNGGELSCPMALDVENPNQNEVTAVSACNESELGSCHLPSDLEDQNPDEMTTMSTYENDEPSCQLTSVIRNLNSDKKTYVLVSEEGELSSLAATPDSGNQNLLDKADISTCSMASGLEINVAESTFLEVQGLPTFFDALKAFSEPEYSLNSAFFPPIGTEETLFNTIFRTPLLGGTVSEIGSSTSSI